MDDVILKDVCDASIVLKLKNGVPLIVGRSKETKIKDTRCSRTQLCVTLNADDKSVLVENVGTNPSALNGIPITRGQKRKATDGDVIEILQSRHLLKVEFTPHAEHPPPATMNTSSSKGTWKSVADNSLLIFTSDQIESRTKIAAFDLSGTIIRTASGRVFPTHYNDWRITYPNVITKLKVLHEEDYKIVIFTNQGGIGKGKIHVPDMKRKIENIARTLSVPLQVFIATKDDDVYRKPRVGMWEHLSEHENENEDINMRESFYCGYAAGQTVHCEPTKKKDFKYCDKKKDFEKSNRLFATNLNLKFFTPVQYFLGLTE